MSEFDITNANMNGRTAPRAVSLLRRVRHGIAALIFLCEYECGVPIEEE